jgi:hypothetical protein
MDSLIANYNLFKDGTGLAASYCVKLSVPADLFTQSVSAIEDKRIEITMETLSGLSLLRETFGFQGLEARVSDFHRSHADEEPQVQSCGLEDIAIRAIPAGVDADADRACAECCAVGDCDQCLNEQFRAFEREGLFGMNSYGADG